MITISNLSKKYPSNPDNTLKDINYVFDIGMYYIIGKSGSGKSTLLNIIGAIDIDYLGSIKYNGKELKEFDKNEKDDYHFNTVSFVFQSHHTNEEESVKINLEKVLDITSLTSKEKDSRIKYLLEKVGLYNKLNEKLKNLSGGEQKRISLVRALLKESEILLVDEPLSSLNDKLRKHITELLFEESKKRCVIIITHEKDEIVDNACILSLENGCLKEIKKGISNNKVTLNKTYERRKFKFKYIFKYALSLLSCNKTFLLITIFALTISLFSISFSFQLSSSISSSLKESLQDYMDDDALVIESKENSYSNTQFNNVSFAKLESIQNKLEDDIICCSNFYLTSLNTLFNENQNVTISYLNSSINIKKISIDSFLYYETFKENEDISFFIGSYSLANDECALILDKSNIFLLMNLFNIKNSLDDESINECFNKMKNDDCYLNFTGVLNDIRYNFSYKIKGIALGDECKIIHNKNDFADLLVDDKLNLPTYYEDEIPLEEFYLTKTSGFRIKRDKVSYFLKDFLNEKSCDEFVCKTLTQSPFYQKDEIETHNHIAIYQDCMNKISVSEIKDLQKKNKDKINSLSFSSSIYTYTASGYITGFSMPFFISRYKDKLNLIEDDSQVTEENLGCLQSSTIEDINGVIKADLTSAMNSDGLTFQSLDNNNSKLLYGKKPESFQEIAISKSLAEQLFNKASKAINETLFTLFLSDTTYDGENYINHFSSGNLTICGIYENDKNVIYQDSLFPLCYAFMNFTLPLSSCRITSAVLNVDLDNYSEDYYLNLIDQSGDYECDFPMLLMIEEIDKTLNEISTIFFIFSIISLIICTFLLAFSLFLIIEKNKKEIGILLLLGYKREEINDLYLTCMLLITSISYIFSLFISAFTEMTLKETLIGELNYYAFNINPFLISFITSLLVNLLISLFLTKKLTKISILEAFKK